MAATPSPIDMLQTVLAAAARGDWTTIANLFDFNAQLWVDGAQPESWHGSEGFTARLADWRRHFALRDLAVADVFRGLQACAATGRCLATIESLEDASVTKRPLRVTLDVHDGRIVAVHLTTDQADVLTIH